MRTHTISSIGTPQLNQLVSLCGWVHRRRDHGHLIFIDLRDYTGFIQIVLRTEQLEWSEAAILRHEFVIQVEGLVALRPVGSENLNVSTGHLELVVHKLIILNVAHAVPFQIDAHQGVGEEVRLRYPYLNMRFPEMAHRLRERARLVRLIRKFLEEYDFCEVETPILTRSTPEGARDYLVPSRTHPGSFFALPQSPQIFKQLLMVGGWDRYYQIARCFRDEDLRADRQPEFTQLDVEMSFVSESDIQNLMEKMFCFLFQEMLGVALKRPFTRLDYKTAIRDYGTDRPDLRIPLRFVEVSDLFQNEHFPIFREIVAQPNSRIAALRVPQGASLDRKTTDMYVELARQHGLSGLGVLKVIDSGLGRAGLQSPIVKFISDECVTQLLERIEWHTGDLVFFAAGPVEHVHSGLGALRIRLASDLNLYQETWSVLWVTDFPMFEPSEDGSYTPMHHPFTAPCDEKELMSDPRQAHARAYDLVLNGFELGGGSIRIHRDEVQYAVFRLLGLSPEAADEQFGHLLTGLRSGCPPHGGIALGIDRIAMLLLGCESIREVIAFPKTQSAQCLMTGSPAPALASQLHDLNIQVNLENTHGGSQ